jgi:hypothetical protein
MGPITEFSIGCLIGGHRRYAGCISDQRVEGDKSEGRSTFWAEEFSGPELDCRKIRPIRDLNWPIGWSRSRLEEYGRIGPIWP